MRFGATAEAKMAVWIASQPRHDGLGLPGAGGAIGPVVATARSGRGVTWVWRTAARRSVTTSEMACPMSFSPTT